MAQSASPAAALGAAGISAGGNLLGGIVSNAMQYSSNKKLAVLQAKLNYIYGREAAKNSPSWNREGLEKAGYNPMLAVQNATSGVNSNWTSSQGVSAPDFGNLGTDAISNAQSVLRLENETKQADANVETAEATAENQRAEAANRREENPYISKRLKSEIGKMDSETQYNNAAIENMKSRLELDAALGFSGLDVQRRGQDMAYSGVVYNADKMKEIADEHSPSGRSLSFNNYMSGIHHGLSGVGELLPYKFGRKGFDMPDFDETQRTVADKNEVYTKKSRRHRRK